MWYTALNIEKNKTETLQMFTTEHILITLWSFNIIYILLLLFIYFLKKLPVTVQIEDRQQEEYVIFKYCNDRALW